jgi:X-Pro dipeptidyl-peptidase
VNQPTTEVTARLVDYGSGSRVDPGTPGQGVHKLDGRSCWGDSVPPDSACYPDFTEDVAAGDLAVVTRGWLDAAHHTSLRERTPLAPDQWYSMTVPLHATDVVIAAGHRLGLVITGTDHDGQTPVRTGARIDVDLGESHFDLPMAGPKL